LSPLSVPDELFTSAPISHIVYPATETTVLKSVVGSTGLVPVAKVFTYPTGHSGYRGSTTIDEFSSAAGLALHSFLVTDVSSINLGSFRVPPEILGDSALPVLPDWCADALAAIIQQQSLPENWDSYGGMPLSNNHARTAWRFLEEAMSDGLPLPDFIPMADGGLQLEWDSGDSQLSFTTEDDALPTLWLSTPGESREIEVTELGTVLALFRDLPSR
jgi:hypothetical protein